MRCGGRTDPCRGRSHLLVNAALRDELEARSLGIEIRETALAADPELRDELLIVAVEDLPLRPPPVDAVRAREVVDERVVRRFGAHLERGASEPRHHPPHAHMRSARWHQSGGGTSPGVAADGSWLRHVDIEMSGVRRRAESLPARSLKGTAALPPVFETIPARQNTG